MVRDHDRVRFAARKRRIAEVAEAIATRHPTGRVDLGIEDTGADIADSLGGDPGKPPVLRGDRNGAALAARGLPIPAFLTGGLDFHPRHECLPIPALRAFLRRRPDAVPARRATTIPGLTAPCETPARPGELVAAPG